MTKEKKQPKNPVVVPEKIHLTGIKLINAKIESAKDKLDKGEEVDLSFDTNSSFNLEHNYCKILFTVIFQRSAASKDEEINAQFGFQYDFIIDNLSDFFIEEGEVLTMNATLGKALMSIVYSTSRGIIMTRTAGTVLDSLLLPIIDVGNLLKLDAVNKH